MLIDQGPRVVVDGGAEVAGCPEHGGIEDQAERPELVLLPRPVCLHDLAARSPWQMSRTCLCRGS